MKREIEKLDHFGRGITFIDGKICFVENALPGEIVKLKILKETKKYFLAEAVDFYRLSDSRIDVKCPYYDVCGGCNLEHLSFKKENEFKCMKVKEILKRFSNISDEVINDTLYNNTTYGYRNKVTLHGDGTILGFYQKDSNNIVQIDSCQLANNKINEVIDILNNYLLNPNNNILEVLIKTSNDLEAVMVAVKGKLDDYSKLQNLIDVLIVNDEVLIGDGSIISNVGNKKYYVSEKSFFQVNKEVTELLYNEVLNLTKNSGASKVLDLYCGTGTIGIYIADYVDKVVGIDVSESSIRDANKNIELNNCQNIRFICDKVENVIEDFDSYDLVIVDPPRSGLDQKTIQNLKRISAPNIIYVSCDPATLGRDLKELETDYEVCKVTPINMFPRTYHVECVCLLNRR